MNGERATLLALLDDVLQRLGKARLSLDMARDLFERADSECTTAGQKIEAAATEVRQLVQAARGP
jgi:exonuclease VII small subunit